jgi:hypothetical protein
MNRKLSSSEWLSRNDFDNFYDWIDYTLDIPSQEEGNENMKKKFMVVAANSLTYETYEEAEAGAKKYTSRNEQPYAVMQAISVTKEVVPEIEVVKL